MEINFDLPDDLEAKLTKNELRKLSAYYSKVCLQREAMVASLKKQGLNLDAAKIIYPFENIVTEYLHYKETGELKKL